MLSIRTKRPASPSLQTSPSKRSTTPSPQKKLVKGFYSPQSSSFQKKLSSITLAPPSGQSVIEIGLMDMQTRIQSLEDNSFGLSCLPVLVDPFLSPQCGASNAPAPVPNHSQPHPTRNVDTPASVRRVTFRGLHPQDRSRTQQSPEQSRTLDVVSNSGDSSDILMKRLRLDPPEESGTLNVVPNSGNSSCILTEGSRVDPPKESGTLNVVPNTGDSAGILTEGLIVDATAGSPPEGTAIPLLVSPVKLRVEIQESGFEILDKHVSLPSVEMPFSLLEGDRIQRSPTREEVAILRKVYPTITEVLHLPPFLIIVCDPVPSTVPRSIAGIPCHFTSDPADIPLKGIFPRGKPVIIGKKLKPWEFPLPAARVEILKHLLQYRARSIGWLGTRWLVDIDKPDDDIHKTLPSVINGLVVFYREFDEAKPHGLNRRKIIPSVNQMDNTNYYPNLHAGMLVCDDNILTTSGCAVKNPKYPDSRFFTVSAHGFANGGKVYHPDSPSDGNAIGEFWGKFDNTDIALAKLMDDSVKYSDETFAGPSGTLKLLRLLPERSNRLGAEIYMDSATTGLSVGYVLAHGTRTVPRSSKVGAEFSFVSNLWVNFEGGMEDAIAGCCGTPLFDEECNVVAFFHWLHRTGLYETYCPTPDPLIDEGFVVANHV